jgi:hypothetical protein
MVKVIVALGWSLQMLDPRAKAVIALSAFSAAFMAFAGLAYLIIICCLGRQGLRKMLYRGNQY